MKMFCGRNWLLLLSLIVDLSLAASSQPPHIVFIVADDYGYNDIGYHGSELKTPTLDKLAGQGIKLENYYVQPICSPTRSQLLSGRYQIHTGLQHGVIRPCVPTALPLEDKTLADKLRESGYKTHMVGKWHIGMYKEEYTPTHRGFDSFFGYLLGSEDYYTHYRFRFCREELGFSGLDFHDNLKPHNLSYGDYSATVFTQQAQRLVENHNATNPLFLYLPFQSVHGPLQVPDKYWNQFSYIRDKKRRTYAGMVAAMDEGIRNLTDTLKSSGLWNNTLLIFTNDNGGEVFAGGNNAPLRGNKASYFEGGVRGVGFVSGPYIKNGGTANHQLIHVSDWYPTLINLVGGSLNGTKLDGYDQWSSIINNTTTSRKEIIYNIDPMYKRKGTSVSNAFDTSVQAALRYGDYKILTGDPGFDKWVPEPTSPMYLAFNTSAGSQNIYLFNIAKDPEERHDLSQSEPKIVEQMLDRLAYWNSTAVPVNYPPTDKRCNPDLRGGVWGPWMS